MTIGTHFSTSSNSYGFNFDVEAVEQWRRRHVIVFCRRRLPIRRPGSRPCRVVVDVHRLDVGRRLRHQVSLVESLKFTTRNL